MVKCAPPTAHRPPHINGTCVDIGMGVDVGASVCFGPQVSKLKPTKGVAPCRVEASGHNDKARLKGPGTSTNTRQHVDAQAANKVHRYMRDQGTVLGDIAVFTITHVILGEAVQTPTRTPAPPPHPPHHMCKPY